LELKPEKNSGSLQGRLRTSFDLQTCVGDTSDSRKSVDAFDLIFISKTMIMIHSYLCLSAIQSCRRFEAHVSGYSIPWSFCSVGSMVFSQYSFI